MKVNYIFSAGNKNIENRGTFKLKTEQFHKDVRSISKFMWEKYEALTYINNGTMRFVFTKKDMTDDKLEEIKKAFP